ncbi:MAG: UDP-N-acetylmuramate--L-alanine ligase [Clostridia bacterium]|nr:UDP-N-acetylmuramate--L-alanine ligase [Clostridia bacterium]
MAIENTHFGACEIARLLQHCNSIYFVGIGGINMSSLALISKQRGFCVGGSDRTETALTRRLQQEGICLFYGHKEEQVEAYDALVYTVAISADNPEYVRAKERGIPCISRSDYMGYLMMDYENRVGISGMHGKSTCTSMCALTLLRGGADPTVLSGAALKEMGGAYRIGGRRHFVFEACEYMDSFLDFNPTVAVVLNVEMDHVDYFHSMEQIMDSFSRFLAKTGTGGSAVLNGDDPRVMELRKAYRGRVLTFGIDSPTADLRAVELKETGGCYSFDLLLFGQRFCHVALAVTGRYNVYNALATAGAAWLCGLSGEAIEDGLASFSGAARRMEYRGSCRGASLYDDYGHHPTEVKATLEGARKMTAEGGRLFCVFQPHTYSRTAALLDRFGDAFSLVDRVWILPIYPARETDSLGMSASCVAKAVGMHAVATDGFSDAAERLVKELKQGDVAVIMGAGDSDRMFPLLMDEFAQKE